MKIKIKKIPGAGTMLAVFYLLLLQSPLEWLGSAFTYIDELFSLVGIGILACLWIRSGKLVIKKATARIVVLLIGFFLTGLLGNLLFRYQPVEAVLIDIFTNFKFFLSVISGYVLFRIYRPTERHNPLLAHTKMVSAVLFVLMCLDMVFEVFTSGGTRYGIRGVQLVWYHPTYLAGSCVFLLAILLAFYEKKNLPYMAMALLVLASTLRGKALAGGAIYVLIFYFLVYYRKKLKLWHIGLIGLTALAIAWEQVSYYYLELSGSSARSALTLTSFEILKDYFPIGTGFGTYASASASEYYSPVYFQYGLNNVHGLSDAGVLFGSDTFWPIIFGQTGAIGTVCFLLVLLLLFLRILKIRKTSIPAYAMGIFIFGYLLISSTSEPAFHNSVAVPLAMLLGYVFTLENTQAKKG